MVAIIALLVSILVPSLGKAKELARRAKCAANLHAMGQAWGAYWLEFNYRTPKQFSGRANVDDIISQFNYVIYCYAGAGGPCYTNAGVLYERKLIANGNVYVCPTMEANNDRPWWSDVLGGYGNVGAANPWPALPTQTTHSRMTYGTRRMQNYDDSSLSALGNGDPKDDQIMILATGVEKIPSTSSFSFMADNFRSPDTALLSHVPGVEVLFLDSHVKFFTDTTPNGEILYNNGLPAGQQGTAFNWIHDDIWMVIDGYHHLPVGQ